MLCVSTGGTPVIQLVSYNVVLCKIICVEWRVKPYYTYTVGDECTSDP